MIWRGEDHSTVFILGAGATRGALGHVVINRKRLKPPLNFDFFAVARTFAKANADTGLVRSRLDRLLHTLRREFSLKGDPQMEEAFSLLYVSKDFPDIYGRRRGRRPAAGTRREIGDFLRITFGMLGALDDGRANGNLYDALARGLGPSDTIITLNYDTTLDSALVRAGWNPKTGYGLMGGTGKIKWRLSAARCSERLEDVRLLKLHGSLNWYVRGSYSRLAGVFERKPALVTAPRRNERSGHIRQIVPPIFGKFFGHEHWGRLWSQAYKALCEAELIVVIGCGLLPSDFHLRALIQRAATVRKEEDNPFVAGIFVDRSRRVRACWKQALRGTLRRSDTVPHFQRFSEHYLRSTSNG